MPSPGRLALLALLTIGCESAAERCERARRAAEEAWIAYEQELEADLAAARRTQSESQAKLTGEVEQRLAEAAAKHADARYDRTSSAWMRAFTAAKLASCRKDEECDDLERRKADATEAVAALGPRLEHVRKAREAVHDVASEAKARADAVPSDFDYASMKRAADASAAAFEACK